MRHILARFSRSRRSRPALAPLLSICFFSACATSPTDAGAARQAPAQYYIAPTGSDWNDGKSLQQPFRSFAHAFRKMRGGDTLVLLDGEYSDAAKTGYISYVGRGSAQPPSGTPRLPTVVRALRPGNVTVRGTLFLGRTPDRGGKQTHIRIEGITFEGGGVIYNGDHITIKDCGFHGTFGIGSNDHHEFSDNNLIEDVWIWASRERIIAINYRSHRNVWRRVVVRGDGCGTAACAGSGNPNVGFSVYDSSDISVQNMIVLDRVLAPTDEPYADFAVAQHTPDPRYYFGRNEWLGTLSLKAPDIGYYMEPDSGQTIDPTVRIVNAVAWDAHWSGMNLSRAGTNNLLENLTVRAGRDDGVRVSPILRSGTLRNVIIDGAGRYGINSAYAPTHVNVHGASVAPYKQTTCTIACYAGNPRADGATPSLRYLTRVEPGSFLKGKGHGGADIGANVLYRYGRDGSRHGEADYNRLTETPLWPWPNEDRIKREMCARTDRGFCAPGKRRDGTGPVTLTSYIWEYLGQEMPRQIYASPTTR